MSGFIDLFKKFLISLFSLAVIDFSWFGFLMKNFYRENILRVTKLSSKTWSFNVPAGLLSWVCIVLGAFIFVRPLVLGESLRSSAIYGALYGFVLYAVYNLTNYATLPGWQLNVSLIDILWGTFLCSVLSILINYLN